MDLCCLSRVGINVGPDPMELIDIEKFRAQLEVNLIAPVAVTQVCVILYRQFVWQSKLKNEAVNQFGIQFGSSLFSCTTDR